MISDCALPHWVIGLTTLSPILAALAVTAVEQRFLPLRIPSAEIHRLADDLERRAPEDPEEAALLEEHAAWHRSQGWERGKWRRVRKELQARRCRRTSHPRWNPSRP